MERTVLVETPQPNSSLIWSGGSILFLVPAWQVLQLCWGVNKISARIDLKRKVHLHLQQVSQDAFFVYNTALPDPTVTGGNFPFVSNCS